MKLIVTVWRQGARMDVRAQEVRTFRNLCKGRSGKCPYLWETFSEGHGFMFKCNLFGGGWLNKPIRCDQCKEASE